MKPCTRLQESGHGSCLMASAAQKLGRRRNRGMGLPKGEEVSQQADQLSQRANRSSPDTNGDSTKARRQTAGKCGSQASDSNPQEAKSVAEIGSNVTNATCGPGQDSCEQGILLQISCTTKFQDFYSLYDGS